MFDDACRGLRPKLYKIIDVGHRSSLVGSTYMLCDEHGKGVCLVGLYLYLLRRCV